jgi:hypothetical protein
MVWGLQAERRKDIINKGKGMFTKNTHNLLQRGGQNS